MLRKVLVASLAEVSIGKLSTSCKKKGAFYHCTVAAKMCGR